MQYRATFSSRYALDRQPHKRGDHIRLMECNLSVMDWHHHCGYMEEPAPHEFAVFDTATRQKGFFEAPRGMDTDTLGAMIAGHFGVSPCLVADRFWVV